MVRAGAARATLMVCVPAHNRSNRRRGAVCTINGVPPAMRRSPAFRMLGQIESVAQRIRRRGALYNDREVENRQRRHLFNVHFEWLEIT
jgi:hypothetical protein